MIVTEADGTRKFQLAFDMRGFEPEEVKIKTQNGAMTISAKKEKKVRIRSSLAMPHLTACRLLSGWKQLLPARIQSDVHLARRPQARRFEIDVRRERCSLD